MGSVMVASDILCAIVFSEALKPIERAALLLWWCRAPAVRYSVADLSKEIKVPSASLRRALCSLEAKKWVNADSSGFALGRPAKMYTISQIFPQVLRPMPVIHQKSRCWIREELIHWEPTPKCYSSLVLRVVLLASADQLGQVRYLSKRMLSKLVGVSVRTIHSQLNELQQQKRLLITLRGFSSLDHSMRVSNRYLVLPLAGFVDSSPESEVLLRSWCRDVPVGADIAELIIAEGKRFEGAAEKFIVFYRNALRFLILDLAAVISEDEKDQDDCKASLLPHDAFWAWVVRHDQGLGLRLLDLALAFRKHVRDVSKCSQLSPVVSGSGAWVIRPIEIDRRLTIDFIFLCQKVGGYNQSGV